MMIMNLWESDAGGSFKITPSNVGLKQVLNDSSFKR